ncbi:MAG: cyclic nucleotide-binding domain-containing protein, partial [Burkholderiaceae bacterium]|nr:cyclic nucleotide-binding domain-containing protein [Burkholderiaceae bacterium]
MDFLIFRRHNADLEGLAKMPLFEGLSKKELGIVAGLMHTREYHGGEVIFDEGEQGQAIYLLLEGEVAICRQGHADGGFLAKLRDGEFFGELGLL